MSADEVVGSPRSAVLPWISLVARAVLGGALFIAGLLKIPDLAQSVTAVQAYEFPIPPVLESFLGYTMPVAEILLGLVVLAGFLPRWSALLGGVFMVGYIAAITSVWVRGLSIDCGCFTPGGSLEPGQRTKYLETILRDTGFLACAAWLVVFPKSRFSLDMWIQSPLQKESE